MRNSNQIERFMVRKDKGDQILILIFTYEESGNEDEAQECTSKKEIIRIPLQHKNEHIITYPIVDLLLSRVFPKIIYGLEWK